MTVLNRRVFRIAVRVAIAVGLVACRPGAGATSETTFRSETNERLSGNIVAAKRQAPDSVAVRVFLDATVSMSGYVGNGSTEYVRFLEELEASAGTATWKTVTVAYNKFGTSVRAVDRAAFLQARSSAFYQEKGIASTTAIENVIDCSGANQLVVVITDLFQKEGDINAIVRQIKERCLGRGVAVGLLGVPSQFDGTVYDARVPSYPFHSVVGDTATYRPFYALMFGEASEIVRLVESLKSRPFINAGYFTLISDRVVSGYDVRMKKAPRSNGLQNSSASEEGVFAFFLKSGADTGTVTASVRLRTEPSAPPVALGELRLIVEPVKPGAKTGQVGSAPDLALRKVTIGKDGEIQAELAISTASAPGLREYDLSLATDAIKGFETPPWVAAFSSDNPTPTTDANRTLNLERFVLDLRRAASSVSPPRVATWRVRIDKKK